MRQRARSSLDQVSALPSRGSLGILTTPNCAHYRRSTSSLAPAWVPNYISYLSESAVESESLAQRHSLTCQHTSSTTTDAKCDLPFGSATLTFAALTSGYKHRAGKHQDHHADEHQGYDLVDGDMTSARVDRRDVRRRHGCGRQFPC